MTALQVVAFTLVMVFGILVVFSPDPLRQCVVNGFFGMSLVLLFLVLQAPDVALSALVVSSVAFPLVLLATIARTREKQEPE